MPGPLAIAALAALAALPPPPGTGPARREEETRKALAAVLDRQVQAWNRGDLEGFVSVYAEDAAFVSPTGLTRGRQAVLDRYRKR
jgi:ketosteroid isomerase-like protein